MTNAALPETCCPEAVLWAGMGRAAYLGPSLRLRAHSGSVHCFALGVDGPFTVRAGGVERRVRSALIPARTRNQIVSDGRMLFLYRDPSAAWLAGIRAKMTALPPLHVDHEDEAALAREAKDGRLPISVLGPSGEVSDSRVHAALELLRTDPGGRLTAAEVAAAVHLSPSRFQHLFSAETGTSFRRYRLWARMQHVGAAVSRGTTLTQAATDAGFASSAHFSDSFRDMFGLSASRLLTPATRLVVETSAAGEPN
ncbi:AraC family transcriptional regulator [Amycolatopsis sp. 195334CR]|uniref:helix-turn-helix transcriptional regulator n=1 Tax=Amycolatopsis sp. 195334CR TaxID=2814588 RepID=UPI001F5C17B9|nr:AraC family transcriptional regulator [Amycolatopsis sp. 195334CR]